MGIFVLQGRKSAKKAYNRSARRTYLDGVSRLPFCKRLLAEPPSHLAKPKISQFQLSNFTT